MMSRPRPVSAVRSPKSGLNFKHQTLKRWAGCILNSSAPTNIPSTSTSTLTVVVLPFQPCLFGQRSPCRKTSLYYSFVDTVGDSEETGRAESGTRYQQDMMFLGQFDEIHVIG